jgi:hypothetical protein
MGTFHGSNIDFQALAILEQLFGEANPVAAA